MMDNEKTIEKAKAKKILVVDDDHLLLTFMETALLSSGYYCKCVEDGLAALDLMEKDDFDLVISDIEMPRLNGFELVSRIKTRFPATKILMISGKYQPNDIIMEQGSQNELSFLTKPFPLNLFLSTIDTVLLSSETRN